MKIFSKLSNIQAVSGISIRPGLNRIGVRKVEAIKKHPRINKYFADGLLAEVNDQPKSKSKPEEKPQPQVSPPETKSTPAPKKDKSKAKE
jgi:hypothetical protein